MSEPTLSHEYVAEQRRLLADPEYAASPMGQMVAKTLETAIAASGYKPPEPDPRTLAQIRHDEAHAVRDVPAAAYDVDWRAAEGHEPGVASIAQEYASALQLPPHLGTAIVNDMLSADGDPDPAEVRAYLARMGRDYGATLAEVQELLNTANAQFDGGRINATDLSAMALVQLAVWSAHTKRHAATRPK